jgi:hypothetical protein
MYVASFQKVRKLATENYDGMVKVNTVKSKLFAFTCGAPVLDQPLSGGES